MSCSYLILNINLFKFNTEGKFKLPGENENHFCGYQMYIPHKVSPPLSHVFSPLPQVSSGSQGFYRTGSHGFYRFLQVSTDLYNKFRAGYSMQVVYVQVLKILILNSHNLKMRIWENNSDHQ